MYFINMMPEAPKASVFVVQLRKGAKNRVK